MKIYPLILSSLLCIISCNKNNVASDDIGQITGELQARLKAGGERTIFIRTSDGFAMPAPNLSAENLEKHLDGDGEFEQKFVSAPSDVNPGLGSIFNHSACISCHPRDGRSGFPSDISLQGGLLMRISLSGKDAHGGPVPVDGFGTQVQNHAIQGQVPEADYNIRFEESSETLADGTKVKLRKPIIMLTNTYMDLPAGILLSPRLAPPVFGLGLLEHIPEANILALEDVNDADNDGISGKANKVWNPLTKRTELGRFGLKANTPTLLLQAANAYNDDMGITSYVKPDETCKGQSNCDESNTNTEITREILDNVTLYTQTLAVPSPINLDKKEVIAGAATFEKIGCAKCHVPQMKTGASDIKALSNQTFYPYTDMLVHDMGEGLADSRPDFLAEGNEWKTRPLWGIGLTQLINGHTDFLHDGRARNLTEAILWHGGEGQASKDNFKALETKERENLLGFLNSL